MNTGYKMHTVEEKYLNKWQKTIDIVARLFDVPAALIMRVHPDQIEVLVSSHSDGNPYEAGEMAYLDTGLYCETVMGTLAQLMVPNALEDEDWKDNPDVKLGMISYLGIPLIWPGGEVFGTICVLDEKTRDFSEFYQSLLWEFKEIIELNLVQSKKYHEELLESEKRLQIIFNNAPVIMLLINENSEVMKINKTGLITAGNPLDKVVGLPIGSALNCVGSLHSPKGCGFGEDCEHCLLREIVSETLATNQNFNKLETSLKLKKRYQTTEHTVLISTSLVNPKSPKTVLVTIDDITERKNMEKALKESEVKYRSMMEAMEDTIYICSSSYRIEYMNPAMIKRIGRNAIGELCYKTIHGLDGKCPWCIHQKVMRGEHVKTEIVSPKDDKTYHVSNSPIFHTDGSVSKLSVFYDLTEIKEMEERLYQMQKMEAIGTLAGGISHDFNNILSPIIGYAEMLKDDIAADSPLHENVTEILHAALRAKNLVSQILATSRQGAQEIMPLHLQPIIKEALKLLRSSIPTTIDIQQNIDPDCGAVLADSTQFHQIVMNLATNAYHAMEESGGSLKITLKQVKMEPNPWVFPDLSAGEYALLKVIDTGTGIEKDIMDKIFNPYFTTKENTKGTGLGLSIVHGIVKNWNGDIRIYSEPGQGTEVDVYLPMLEQSITIHDIEESKTIPRGTEKILLVDDEEVIARMETNILQQLGYRITMCTGSIEALEAFKANQDDFDLVITDMTMPDMTGVQLANEIKKIRPGIPVIIFTGFSDHIDEEKCKALNIQGYAMKPLMKREIAETIRKVLDN